MLSTEEIEKTEADIPIATDRNKQQGQIEKSFVKGLRELNGEKLAPYSPSREAAADSMGMRYGRVNKELVSEFSATGLYPGMKRDIGIVMWLCVKATEDEIDAAGVDGMAAARKANEWARAMRLQDTGDKRFSEAYNLFLELMNERYAATVKAEKKTTSSGSAK